MRAAMIGPDGICYNMIIVDDIGFLPGLIEADNRGDIGDYWDGEEFINLSDPRHPNYVPPEEWH